MYTFKDVINMLSISERKLRRQLASGVLKGNKVGGKWLFTEDDISDYLQQQEVTDSLKKNTHRNVFDYLNGFVDDSDKVVYMMSKHFENEDELKSFVEVTKTFEKKFKLGVNQVGNNHVITFIGYQEDLEKLIQKGTGTNEDNLSRN